MCSHDINLILCRDIFSEHLAPLKIEFGHVCENPTEWEQRFERKEFDNNRHSGKVIVILFSSFKRKHFIYLI